MLYGTLSSTTANNAAAVRPWEKQKRQGGSPSRCLGDGSKEKSKKRKRRYPGSTKAVACLQSDLLRSDLGEKKGVFFSPTLGQKKEKSKSKQKHIFFGLRLGLKKIEPTERVVPVCRIVLGLIW